MNSKYLLASNYKFLNIFWLEQKQGEKKFCSIISTSPSNHRRRRRGTTDLKENKQKLGTENYRLLLHNKLKMWLQSKAHKTPSSCPQLQPNELQRPLLRLFFKFWLWRVIGAIYQSWMPAVTWDQLRSAKSPRSTAVKLCQGSFCSK